MGGRGASSGGGYRTESSAGGGSRYVASSFTEAAMIARNGRFHTRENNTYKVDDKSSPGQLASFKSSRLEVRVDGLSKTYSAEVSHSKLVDGTSLWKVEGVSPTVMYRIGGRYTKGRSTTRSGYIYSSKSEAELAARRAVQYQLKRP